MKKKISFDKKSLTNFLTSKFVLNVVFIVAFFNFISHIMYGKIHIVIMFILIALLTSHFSKNMIIVLLVPLLLVNLYNSFMVHHVTEGLENNDNSSTSSTNTNVAKIKTAEEIKDVATPPVTKPDENPVAKPSKKNEESFDVPNKKNKYNIDYASTVEEAYDNLNNILGGDNIKKLSKDTEGLVNQQLQLAEAMKNIEPLIGTMGPLLKQAEGLLGTMGGGDNINKIMQSLNINKDKSK